MYFDKLAPLQFKGLGLTNLTVARLEFGSH